MGVGGPSRDCAEPFRTLLEALSRCVAAAQVSLGILGRAPTRAESGASHR
jgi:hypothetical protein